MREEKLWLLVAGKLTGQASATELLLLEDYLQKNKKAGLQVATLECIWKQAIKQPEPVPARAIDHIMERIKQQQ